MPKARPVAERFWPKVLVGDDNDCWPWLARKNNGGYGDMRFMKPKRIVLAHRVSWELHHGPIPDGLWVLHKCDNRACVNPSHLFLGTALDNNRDMMSKGRHRPGKHYTHYGSRNPSALLREDQVREIRALFKTTLTISTIGAMYGVSKPTIEAIKYGRTWRSLPHD